jgi:MSHA pilin protein MshA
MRIKQRGFTLIELVVVITILGILAAFAIPKFLSLDKQARIAAISALQGSVRSAASLTHSMSMAGVSPVVMDGTTITMLNGYPTRTAGGIDLTLQDMSGFTYTPATGLFSANGAPTPANCSFSYTAAGVGGSPTISVVDSTGC